MLYIESVLYVEPYMCPMREGVSYEELRVEPYIGVLYERGCVVSRGIYMCHMSVCVLYVERDSYM